MKDELFQELLQSVKEGAAIMKGEMQPSRRFEFPETDVRALRERYRLSQDKFASLVGISVATLRNWEQGRRKPEGPARLLLRIAELHPEVLLDLGTFDADRPRRPRPVTTLLDVRGALGSEEEDNFVQERARAKTAVAKRVTEE